MHKNTYVLNKTALNLAGKKFFTCLKKYNYVAIYHINI